MNRRFFLKLVSVIPVLPKVYAPLTREEQLFESLQLHARQAANRGEIVDFWSWYPYLDCKPDMVFVKMFVKDQHHPYTWNVIFEPHVPIRGISGEWKCLSGHRRVLMGDSPNRRLRCPVCEGFDGPYRQEKT